MAGFVCKALLAFRVDGFVSLVKYPSEQPAIERMIFFHSVRSSGFRMKLQLIRSLVVHSSRLTLGISSSLWLSRVHHTLSVGPSKLQSQSLQRTKKEGAAEVG